MGAGLSKRQPTIFLSHGGGPCFWITLPPPFGPHAFDNLKSYLAGLLSTLDERPKAILVISGHWEEGRPTVSTAAAPPMFFDYQGFPKHTYQLSHPAPGAPDLAEKVRTLLAGKGIETDADAERGFDHGVFVPLMIIDAEARIPIVMLSMQQDMDPAFHMEIGNALVPLRDEGILIVGSGMSYHNVRAFPDGASEASAAFDGWLDQVVSGMSPEDRRRSLIRWAKAPGARACHPREDHLMPLMVVAGAADDDSGRRVFNDRIAGKTISAFAFGQ